MTYQYKELPPKTWATICVSAYLVGVVATGAATLPDDIGACLALSLIYLVVLVPFLGVPISKLIYHRIQLTPDTLRVGRERIPVMELDAASIRAAQGAGAPPLAERVARSLSTNDVPVPGLRASDHGAPRLVGGAWGVPMGMDSVVIATRQGQQLAIVTRNRTGLLAALVEATSPPPP